MKIEVIDHDTLPVVYKKFEDLTASDIDLLCQAWIRLRAEGIAAPMVFGDFLDIVLARGEYSNTNTDAIYAEGK